MQADAEIATFLAVPTSAPATQTGTARVGPGTRVDGTTAGRAVTAEAT